MQNERFRNIPAFTVALKSCESLSSDTKLETALAVVWSCPFVHLHNKT